MTHPPLLDTPVSRTENQLSSTLGAEEILLDLQDGIYYGLNQTGARVWALLAQAQTPRSLCDRLEQEYNADRAVLEADVLALLDHLEREGLVEFQRVTGAH